MTRFENKISEARAQSPLSVTAIGLYMLFGACLMPLNIYLHRPAFLLVVDFRGWKATVFFVAMGTLDAVIGIGLLRFASWSRIAAIYFFVFRIVNMSLTFLLPGSRRRFEEGIEAMQAALGQQAARRSPIWFGPAIELSVMAFVLWLLFRRHRDNS
jgi:hypothetical protein